MVAQIEPIEKRIVLDELRRALDKLYDANDMLDSKIQQLLGYTALIAAISGTLQLSSLRQVGGVTFWIILAVALIIYAAIFLVAFRALHPITREFPVSGDWDTLYQKYFDEGENPVLDRVIHDYIIAAEEITKTNSEKSDAVRTLMWLMGALVGVILLAMPISLLVTPCASPLQTP